MNRATALILLILCSALSMFALNAVAYASPDEAFAMCSSAMFKALMSTAVTVPQRDLAVPVYVLEQLRVLGNGPNCPAVYPGTTYRSLLLDYVEHRWIDDVTEGTPPSTSTVGDAIRSEVERRTSVTDIKADNDQFFARRRLAYKRTFEVQISDAQATANDWSERIGVTVVNVSNWPIHWYAGIGQPPELWFEPAAGSAPVKFYCTLTEGDRQALSVVASGQRVELSCEQQAAPHLRETQPLQRSDLTSRDNWALHSATISPDAVSLDKMDVALWSPEIQQAARSLINTSSCQERDACEIEKSVRKTERNAALGVFSLWPIALGGFFAGAIAFFIGRLITESSAENIAGVLSVVLVLGMAAATAVIYFSIQGSGDGFKLLGLGMIWFALLFAVVPALLGVRVARAISASVTARRL
jgi:hypothetical protein